MRRSSLLAAMTIGLTGVAPAQDPPPPFSIVAPRPNGIVAADINDRGEIVGFEWTEPDDRPGEIHEKPFLARDGAMTYLPTLDGYTATSPAAISDTGQVAGRASKPAPRGVRVTLRNQAFVWDAEGGIRGLGALPDDNASAATGITRDGRRVSGFSVGDGRFRACYWEREGDGWRAAALPSESPLGSNVVAISGDGRWIAAVDGEVPCLWHEEAPGRWVREVLGPPGSLIPRAVNDRGTVVGLRHNPDGNSDAVVRDRAGDMRLIPKPEGYTRAEANAVNNAGVVVGMIDGPRGSEIGPRGFAFEAGALQILDSGGLPLTAATAINDRRQVAGVLEKEEDDDTAVPEGNPGPESPGRAERRVP